MIIFYPSVALVIVLVLLPRLALSLARHRYSYVFDTSIPESSIQGDVLKNIGSDTVKISNFTGIKEWKMAVRLGEFAEKILQEELPPWKPEWKVRFQMLSPDAEELAPILTRALPGFHVGLDLWNASSTPRLDINDEAFVMACRYLYKIFPIFLCPDHEGEHRSHAWIDLKQSITLPRSRTYLHQFHANGRRIVVSDSRFGNYALLKNGWKQPAAIDLNILFDSKNNMDMLELRMVWKLKEQTEEIIRPNQSDERVEVGVFESLHDGSSYIGARSIIGDNKILPTLLTIPTVYLSEESHFFNSTIPTPHGFHPSFVTEITIPPGSFCEYHIVHSLPDSYFVDPYQIEELFPDGDIEIWGDTDLEKPVNNPTSLYAEGWMSTGSVVKIRTRIDGSNTSTVKFSLPIHLRYHHAAEYYKYMGYLTVNAFWPYVIENCIDETQVHDALPLFVFSPEVLFAPVPLPLSLILSEERGRIRYVMPNYDRFGLDSHAKYSYPAESINVPIGESDMSQTILFWTMIAVICGSFWLSMAVIRFVMRMQADKVENKMD